MHLAYPEVRYNGQGHVLPKKYSFPPDTDPHLIHGSLDPQQCAPQTASRSVHPFLQGSPVCMRVLNYMNEKRNLRRRAFTEVRRCEGVAVRRRTALGQGDLTALPRSTFVSRQTSGAVVERSTC